MAATAIGWYYVFSMDGEIRAKVNIQPNCKDLVSDCSGLYCAIRQENDNIHMLETGTGRRVYDFKTDYKSCSFGFSTSC
jgi:hypothetical protein